MAERKADGKLPIVMTKLGEGGHHLLYGIDTSVRTAGDGSNHILKWFGTTGVVFKVDAPYTMDGVANVGFVAIFRD